jgi:hypothetical protein
MTKPQSTPKKPGSTTTRRRTKKPTPPLQPGDPAQYKLFVELIKRLRDGAEWTDQKGVYLDEHGTPFAITSKWNEELQRPCGHRVFLNARDAWRCRYPSAPTANEIRMYGSTPTTWAELHRGDPPL